mmetsp:Transcript_25530/g.31124  ORF Transcript_25530/g.31124 Transcript_25530/m.31124 type:complete len:214 (-) Transcript_25530:29-670(-)
MATLLKWQLPSLIGRFLSFCRFRDSRSRLSRMCLGMSFKAFCKTSPKHTSHFRVAPPSSMESCSKKVMSPSKGAQTMKHSCLSVTWLTCHKFTLPGNFSCTAALTWAHCCSSGRFLNIVTTPPSCAWKEFFLACVGLASNFGSAALAGRRRAELSSLISILESFKAVTTSSFVARMVFILLHCRIKVRSNHPSLFSAIFSWKNLSYLRFSSLK